MCQINENRLLYKSAYTGAHTLDGCPDFKSRIFAITTFIVIYFKRKKLSTDRVGRPARKLDYQA